jgi:hypothetical protein
MSEEQLGDGKHWGLGMCGSWHGFSHLRKIPGFFVRCVFSDVYLDWLDLFCFLLAVLVIFRHL